MPLARPNGMISHPPRLRVFSDNASIYFSQEMSHTLEELEEEEWYSSSLNESQSEINWAPTHKLTKTDYGPGVVCYMPLDTSSGENPIRHVAALFFDETPLYNFMLTESTYGYRVFLLDGSNHIITSTERDLLLNNFDSIGLSTPLSELETGMALQYQKENYFCQIQPLLSTESTLNSWKVVRLMPAKTIYYSVIQAVVPGLLLCVFFLTFGLLLIIFMTNSLRKRVSHLNHNIHEVMDSGFEKRTYSHRQG